MRIVGIDPGLSGAIAAADVIGGRAADPRVYDMPVTDTIDGRKLPDHVAIYDIIRDLTPDLVILEHVEARPGRGSVSTWRFAQGFGGTLAAVRLACDGPRVHLVRPAIWKAALGLSSEKSESLTLARTEHHAAADQLARAKDDGRAESLLLITYYQRVLMSAHEMEVC